MLNFDHLTIQETCNVQMGRGKLSMELIKNWKARNLAFQIRKNTLKKKVYELATLCGIKAMVIIYGPKQDTLQTCPPPEPEVLPDNRDQVLDLINNYKGQSPEDRRKKTVLLSDFYKGKIEKAEKDLTDLRYPTWDPRFNSFTENDLCRFVADLENIAAAKDVN
ncbi:agamous-like MADS-box protein AGL80 [Apium graveolens]|uniref:agamous-like MADS-box protein AGL80 n=1 Tax=Apium graveolens TaxID=4045 RepID=UPI003D78F9C4